MTSFSLKSFTCPAEREHPHCTNSHLFILKDRFILQHRVHHLLASKGSPIYLIVHNVFLHLSSGTWEDNLQQYLPTASWPHQLHNLTMVTVTQNVSHLHLHSIKPVVFFSKILVPYVKTLFLFFLGVYQSEMCKNSNEPRHFVHKTESTENLLSSEPRHKLMFCKDRHVTTWGRGWAERTPQALKIYQYGPQTSAHLEDPKVSTKLLPNWMSLSFKAKSSGNSQFPQGQGDFF